MLEHFESLVSDFDFTAPRVMYGHARVYTRAGLGTWIGRKQRLYVVASQPIQLISSYTAGRITTRSVAKPFVWLTPEHRLVITEGPRIVYVELKTLIDEPISDEKLRWLEIGLRQDVVAMTGECARHNELPATSNAF
jgi:hypothetical protein